MTTEAPRWFTSSHSDNGGACVEVAANLAGYGVIPVRDTKDRRQSLTVGPRAFARFVGAVRSGRLGG